VNYGTSRTEIDLAQQSKSTNGNNRSRLAFIINIYLSTLHLFLLLSIPTILILNQAGAFSGCVTRAITQPLDCSKVRLQLQVEPVANIVGAKYSGTIQTLFAIFRDEGVFGLWKGHVPAQLLSVFYGLGQFAAYDQLNAAGRHVKLLNEHSDMRHFICGGIAGAVGNTVSTPFDVIRTRIIAQDHGRGYSSMRDGLRLIFINEGFRGLFRGLGPSVLQVAPLTAIQFWAYNVVIETVLDYTKSE
jgi:solute carrier family 25 thiamine pyrophosphate transporter 19